MQKVTCFRWNSVLGGFEIADYKFEIRMYKYNMVDVIWRTRMQKVLDLDKTQYLVAFEVADYVSKIFKFNFFVQFFSI